MHEENIPFQKKVVRQEFLNRRKQISEHSRISAMLSVSSHLELFVKSHFVTRVIGYLSTPTELSIDPFLMACERLGIPVAVPIVRNDLVKMVEYHPATGNLCIGEFGIREPDSADSLPSFPVHPGDRVLICVPGVAFDQAGNRLGRGKGHYDRTLASSDRMIRMGVLFSTQLSRNPIPVEHHDLAMHNLAMPSGILKCQ